MIPSVADIVAFLELHSTKPLKAKDLARALNVPSEEYHEFRQRLREMAQRGTLYPTKGQRFAPPDRLNLVVGTLQVVKSGAGFVIPEDRTLGDVFVPSFKLATAVHGDKVVARVEKRPPGTNPEGRIIKVLERARSRLVGTFRRSRHFNFVEPDDPKLTFDVYVSLRPGVRAEEGQKVLVEVEDWGDAQKNPEGTVQQVLGFPDDPGVDVLSILHDHGLDAEFPPAVERAAERLPLEIPRQEIARRLDLREKLTFTIDPANAKDFDDALSIERVGEPAPGNRGLRDGRDGADGLWEVGIHIADVSHYVEPGTALDEAASARATSVYLVDRVVPMLPERLSNQLCSLNPGEDKLTVSVLVTLDSRGAVHAARIVETVIRSRARLTYQEAQALLDGKPSSRQPEGLGEAVHTLRDLSRELMRRRAERGSLDFDLPEAEVILDDEGFPLDIQESVRLDSHRLIEEFMLLANEIVAQRAQKRRVPSVYRIHEEPDPLKLENLREFAGVFGYVIPPGQVTPRVLRRVLERAAGTPEEKLLNTIVLRSMKQARYSVENVGHFGLASDWYTHFTSPIRRYPDLLVHRTLKRLDVEAARAEEQKEEVRRDLARMAEHASARERVAQDAERESVALKKVEFMERHLGEVFSGTISGVQAFGFFVRLDRYFVEGLVHVNSLTDDYYLFEERQYSLVGKNTARTFRLGDRVDVQVAKVDRLKRQVDFALVEEHPRALRSGGKSTRERRPRRETARVDGDAGAQPERPGRRAGTEGGRRRITSGGPRTGRERGRSAGASGKRAEGGESPGGSRGRRPDGAESRSPARRRGSDGAESRGVARGRGSDGAERAGASQDRSAGAESRGTSRGSRGDGGRRPRRGRRSPRGGRGGGNGRRRS